MPLILGFVELLGAFILITKGIGGQKVTWADVLKGHAGAKIRTGENKSATATATSAGGGWPTTLPASTTAPFIGVIGTGGGKLNSNQQAFAARLAHNLGLNLAVVQGWVLSEEPASSVAAPNGANNWLNIGDTGSGNYGGAASVWSDPIAAADFTAQWIQGLPLAGYGVASSGIQAIAQTAGQTITAQVRAIQSSGWAASGYPNLMSVVAEFL